MVLSYPYKKLPGKKGSSIKTPSIPITFNSKKSKLKFDVVALVDSGADLSIIPRGLAEVLNLDLSGKKNTSWGITGKSIDCIESKIKIYLGNSRTNFQIKIPLLISPNDKCPVILGRRGFFEFFKITFDSKNSKVHLKEYTSIHPI